MAEIGEDVPRDSWTIRVVSRKIDSYNGVDGNDVDLYTLL